MNLTNIIEAIDSGEATEVRAAFFETGEESEILVRFYRLAGEVLRYAYNKRSTTSDFSWVRGENRELFDAYYKA